MITENVSTLKIHKLTQTQYDRELEAGNLEENAIYLTPNDFDAMSAENPTGTGTLSLNRVVGSTMGVCSVAMGYQTEASGDFSYAEGNSTIADGVNSHAQGRLTKATTTDSEVYTTSDTGNGYCTHAEGYGTVSLGVCSHAEGQGTKASGHNSHSQGKLTVASGDQSHAQGYNCTASGHHSFAGGHSSQSEGTTSFSHGFGLVAKNYQTVFGKYNSHDGFPGAGASASAPSDNTTLFMVGNGTADDARSNCLRLTSSGNLYLAGTVSPSGADFAEFFEWADGNPDNEDRRGKFVTLDGEKIKLANTDDDYILGVVSATPCVVGNASSEEWHNKYLVDEFGIKMTREVEITESIDESTGKIIPAHTEIQYILNPEYDDSREYISREFRQEWSPIGLHGQLIVVDDGTCQVNGYCSPMVNGVGTMSESGYRVMSRIDETHIKVCVK